MPYSSEVSPIRIDLSALGATPDGEPFYAIMHTWKSLPHPELRALIQQYPEIIQTALNRTPENAQTLLISPAYPAMAAAFVLEWNLTDPVKDTPLPVPREDETVITRVPTAVWQHIIQHLSRRPAPPSPKNSRLQVIPRSNVKGDYSHGRTR